MNDPWHEGAAGSSFAPRPKPAVSPEKRIEELERNLAEAKKEKASLLGHIYEAKGNLHLLKVADALKVLEDAIWEARR